nr:immunoglobulin light chain junction region [Macaca mulatta]MOX35976.1 immunoglobulin light chain junction region [Macaca mulatta]MOX36068.1 immunoglobulin light chain junction region [Macaca mulatta]
DYFCYSTESSGNHWVF